MNSHLTAISRKNVSVPMRMFESAGLLLGRVLDYGCGRGKDVELLGLEGYDPHFFPEKPKGLYDTVTMNYVINTISDHDGRMDAIRGAWDLLNVGGYLVVSARKVMEVKKNASNGGWDRYSDGYKTSKGTFQKGFTDKEIEDLMFMLLDGMIAKSPVSTTLFSHAIAIKTRF